MKKTGCVIVVLFLILCLSMFFNMLFLSLLGAKKLAGASGMRVLQEKQFEEEVVSEGSDSSKKIAVIPLRGVISYGAATTLGESLVSDFKAALHQALHDPEVQAVVLSVDSPGGEITASDVLYHEISKFKHKKPVVVYFNSMGASGAYYAACGSSWIMCNDTTFTGSIGVIIETLNYKELFGKIGLQTVVFKSGKFKDMLNGDRDMTPEESTYVQSLVMQSYGRFVGIVAAARKIDEQTLRNGIADGRVLSGTDAFQAKLVDQLGYIEDAYAKARELGNAPGAQIVQYKRQYGFEHFFKLFGEARATDVHLDLLGKMPELESGRVYLLPPFFAP